MAPELPDNFRDVFPGGRVRGIESWHDALQIVGCLNQLALLAWLHNMARHPTPRKSLAHEDAAFNALRRAAPTSPNKPLLPRLRTDDDFPVGMRACFCLAYLPDDHVLDKAKHWSWIEGTVVRQDAMGAKPKRLALRAGQTFWHDGHGEHATIGLDRDLFVSPAIIATDDLMAFREHLDDPFKRIWLLNASEGVTTGLEIPLDEYAHRLLKGTIVRL